jgi:hypothetical protein
MAAVDATDYRGLPSVQQFSQPVWYAARFSTYRRIQPLYDSLQFILREANKAYAGYSFPVDQGVCPYSCRHI